MTSSLWIANATVDTVVATMVAIAMAAGVIISIGNEIDELAGE